MAGAIVPRVFKGTEDLLPEEMIPLSTLIDRIRGVFERFGFAPIQTPAIEYLDILLGKYGAEGEKLIYPLAYKGGNVAALRYDLTVPLSRVVAMNPALPRPFRRYQIAPVWRADNPQREKGRYREFIQCDVDTVGTRSLLADAENVAVVDAALQAAGLPRFVIRVNHRRLLRAVVAHAELPAEREGDVLRALDKLDKTSRESVVDELGRGGIAPDAIARLFGVIEISSDAALRDPDRLIDRLEALMGASPDAGPALGEVRELMGLIRGLGVPADRVALDLCLTRGLDYYTGPVYEVRALDIPGFGSLGGGGRYDDLIGMYGKETIPATGVSIGLSRVFGALQRLGLIEPCSTPTRVLVARLPGSSAGPSLELVTEIRKAAIPAEIWPDADRLKRQLEFAAKKGIPLVAIVGEDEIRAGAATLRDMRRGAQTQVPRAGLAESIRAALAGPQVGPA